MLKDVKKAFDFLILDETCFLAIRLSRTGATKYAVYDKNMNIKMVITSSSFKILKEVLIKKGQKYFVSKKLIRSQHGNTYFKKRYKEENKKGKKPIIITS